MCRKTSLLKFKRRKGTKIFHFGNLYRNSLKMTRRGSHPVQLLAISVPALSTSGLTLLKTRIMWCKSIRRCKTMVSSRNCSISTGWICCLIHKRRQLRILSSNKSVPTQIWKELWSKRSKRSHPRRTRTRCHTQKECKRMSLKERGNWWTWNSNKTKENWRRSKAAQVFWKSHKK